MTKKTEETKRRIELKQWLSQLYHLENNNIDGIKIIASRSFREQRYVFFFILFNLTAVATMACLMLYFKKELILMGSVALLTLFTIYMVYRAWRKSVAFININMQQELQLLYHQVMVSMLLKNIHSMFKYACKLVGKKYKTNNNEEMSELAGIYNTFLTVITPEKKE